MGAKVSRNDFEWVYTQHPHVSRRKAILGESLHCPELDLLIYEWTRIVDECMHSLYTPCHISLPILSSTRVNEPIVKIVRSIHF